MNLDVQTLVAGPFAAHQIIITYVDHSAAPPDISARIEWRWKECVDAARRDGRMLFNGPVAYMKRTSTNAGIWHLELAPTDYKTFLVTTLRDRAWFEQHCPAAVTPALGNSILLTHGSVAYLGVRSKAVAAYPKRAHLFGGVLDWPKYHGNTGDVLLEHLYLELNEELGIGPNWLTAPPRVLALLRDPFLAQPEVVWHGELKAPLQLPRGTLNIDEHDAIIAVSLSGHFVDDPPQTPVSAAAIGLVTRTKNCL
jgi:hypothetical protein